MMVVMDSGWSDQEILSELGGRLRRERLNRNLTQRQLAESAGVSDGSVKNLEAGSNTSLATLVRLMRALDLIGRLDSIAPEPAISPLQLAARRGEVRHRATGRRTRPK